MSKRLQILIPDEEYRLIIRTAKKRKKSISSLAREGLQLVVKAPRRLSSEERLARILKFAKYSAPTADIEEMLAQIESGKEG